MYNIEKSSEVTMAQKIYTFSVSEREETKLARIEKIKADCKRTGKSFSHVVIEALLAKSTA